MKILLNNTSLFESLRPFNDLGFVPTMGGIHKGHLSLINKSNKFCKKTIVSIFINPKQFNNKNDLKSFLLLNCFGFTKILTIVFLQSFFDLFISDK